jgi:hypothetical protein
MVLDFTTNAADLEGQAMPQPRSYLAAAKQKKGKDLLTLNT